MRTALSRAMKIVFLGSGHKDARAVIIHRIAVVITAITIVFSLAMGATGFEFASRSKFFEPFYLSWISGAGLFLVSILIAIQQLDDPANESSRRRMEILMKGRDGPAVEYFIRRFHEFEHYAEYSRQRIVIKEYSQDGRRIQVEKSVSMLLKNFIEDVWSIYSHQVAHDTGVADDGLAMLYLRVDGKSRSVAEFNEGQARKTAYDIRIEPEQGVLVEFGLRHWIENPQILVQSVPRFTSELTLEIENHTDRPVNYAWDDHMLHIPPGDAKPVLQLHDLAPGLAYRGNLSLI